MPLLALALLLAALALPPAASAHRLGDPVPPLPVPVPPLADPYEVVPDRNPPREPLPETSCAPPSICDVPNPPPFTGGDPDWLPPDRPTETGGIPHPEPTPTVVYGVLRRVSLN